jgi:membrane associated rhomboid family serine protease
VLIGVNVGVFILQLAQARMTDDYGLYGPFVAEGEWWRLLTSAFLHGGPIHLLFNMLMLWWFGGPLESLLGRGRFIGLYLVSALAGSAGALLLSPRALTVGASGAVFGILGAGLLLERKRIYVFGGGALMVVLFNVGFSFLVPNVSIGGHLGGLAGGVLAMLALSRFGRGHAVYGRVGLAGVAGLVAVGVASVAIAYARVLGLA